jgi:4-amino-4-deoxy-L-arabinose transferase-like glycosyltransferase
MKKFQKNHIIIVASIIILVIFRFFLTGFIPLLDKTEARYAEIARLMYETNEWVVLQIDYGIPFWAKPPLSTWLSAICLNLFGVNEIASRLPSFILCIVILIILGKLVKKSGASFYLPAFILLTTPEFLIHLGVVSTDVTLTFSITLIMLSFWKAMLNDKKTYWNYLFFFAIGLGLLSKGPIAIILTGPPIFIWCLLDKKRWKKIFTRLPWLIGVLITGVTAIPWYILTEKKTPGFIDYFVVGEHFKRFLDTSWKGDLYGFAKTLPIGMIWVFLFIFAFPWIQILFVTLWKNRKTIFKDSWISFLVLWLFWIPVFFTFTKSGLHTYILPSVIPMALLLIFYWGAFKEKVLLRLGLIFPTLVVLAFLGLLFSGQFKTFMNTDKFLLKHQQKNTNSELIPVYYWFDKTYSSQFYSSGKVQIIKNLEELDSVLTHQNSLFFTILKKREKEIPEKYKTKFTFLESNQKTSIYYFQKE